MTAGTTRRFLLLLVVVFLSCLSLYQHLAAVVLVGMEPACVHAPRCRLTASTQVFWPAASAMGSVLLAVFAGCWWLPAWRTHRRRLTPLPDSPGD